MAGRASMRSRSGARGIAALALLTVAVPAPAREPADALAFIRVIGDLHAEFTSAWHKPIDEKDVEFATGSGFVIAPSGLVLTNHHVVDLGPMEDRIDGQEAEVTLENARIEVALGREGSIGVYEASVVTSDEDLDLAVLQVTAADLPYVPFGDSDATEAGNAVKVMGFPFGRRVEVGKRRSQTEAPRPTITTGSLSAVRADDAGDARYLQTDASVNPGSSGGPMMDQDGYAVGVVRMKLYRRSSGGGAGFAIPINLVKDFLDAHSLLGQLPVERLYPGVVHTLDWKKLRIELPDGFSDTSPARLFADTGEAVGGVSLQAARVATPWDLQTLEEAALRDELWRGFAPGPVGTRRETPAGNGRVVASGLGERKDGTRFRVDYALVDLGPEKVVARYLGPPDEMAFNLSLVRRSLKSLEASPLLTDEVKAPLKVGFDASDAAAVPGGVPLPSGWSREPAARSACAGVPPAEAGVAASPAGDYTVVLRVLRWRGGAFAPEEVARACQPGTAGPTFALGYGRLGVATGTWGTFLTRGREILLLEADAPEAKLPFVRDLYVEWTKRATEAR
jgi:S1-C subfamily serine protease